MRTLAVETAPDAAAAGPAGTDQRPHPHLAGPHHRGTGTRRPAGRVPVVRRAGAHLRGRQPAHRQRRSWPDRSRGAAGRPGGRADGDPAQRAGRHRRAVPAGCGRRGDAARRRPGRGGPARGSNRDPDRPHQPRRAARALPGQILVLGGGESRDLHLPEDTDVIDMEQIDPDAVELPGVVPAEPGTGPGSGVHRRSPRPAASWWPSRSPTTGGRCRPSGPRRRPPSTAETPCTA